MNKLLKNSLLGLIPNSARLRYLLNRPVLEEWKRNSGDYPIFETRFQMYDHINNEVLANKAIDYLEFGVFQGESIRYFSQLNTDPESRFSGFDTFEGLPEDWVEFSRTVKSETFSTDGNIPDISDDRVNFIKGLFQDTLPGFLERFSPEHQLVIHNDSDLYSATLYVLTLMNDYIASDTIVIFDEFYSVMDEFRALIDYCSAYMRDYEVLAATSNHTQVAIRFKA